MNAEIGTPCGSLAAGSITRQWLIGAVKREFGCAALRPQSGVQSTRCEGGVLVMPCHHTSPSTVSATLVKMVLALIEAIAFGLDCTLVPGATPKKPASGLIALSLLSSPALIQAMSSPTVVTFQPSSWSVVGGTSMAKLVLPQALGKAAATLVFSPLGFSTPRMSMCSANQPSSRASTEAMRSAKHFLP